jgi:hypothetical protein
MRNKVILKFILVAFMFVAILIPIKTDVLVKFGIADELNQNNMHKVITEIKDGKNIIVLNDVNKNERQRFINMVYDSPDIFWLDLKYYVVSLGDIDVIVFNQKYDDINEKKVEIQSEIEKIINNIIKEDMTEYEKVLIVHNWVCNNIEYGILPNNGDQEIYGALFSQTSRCAGYAKLFTMLLNDAGIKSSVISGNALESDGTLIEHAWNVVYIDNEPYYFDVTWDDKGEDGIVYNWFGVTTTEFKQNHFPSIGYEWVNASSTKACYYMRNSMYIDQYDSDLIVDQIEKQGLDFSIKCSDNDVLNNVIDALSTSTEIQKIMRGSGIRYINQLLYEEESSVNCIRIIIQ